MKFCLLEMFVERFPGHKLCATVPEMCKLHVISTSMGIKLEVTEMILVYSKLPLAPATPTRSLFFNSDVLLRPQALPSKRWYSPNILLR